MGRDVTCNSSAKAFFEEEEEEEEEGEYSGDGGEMGYGEMGGDEGEMGDGEMGGDEGEMGDGEMGGDGGEPVDVEEHGDGDTGSSGSTDGVVTPVPEDGTAKVVEGGEIVEEETDTEEEKKADSGEEPEEEQAPPSTTTPAPVPEAGTAEVVEGEFDAEETDTEEEDLDYYEEEDLDYYGGQIQDQMRRLKKRLTKRGTSTGRKLRNHLKKNARVQNLSKKQRAKLGKVSKAKKHVTKKSISTGRKLRKTHLKKNARIQKLTKKQRVKKLGRKVLRANKHRHHRHLTKQVVKKQKHKPVISLDDLRPTKQRMTYLELLGYDERDNMIKHNLNGNNFTTFDQSRELCGLLFLQRGKKNVINDILLLDNSKKQTALVDQYFYNCHVSRNSSFNKQLYKKALRKGRGMNREERETKKMEKKIA